MRRSQTSQCRGQKADKMADSIDSNVFCCFACLYRAKSKQVETAARRHYSSLLELAVRISQFEFKVALRPQRPYGILATEY